MQLHKALLLLVGVGVLSAAFVTPGIAATFEIDVSDSIDTPERTVSNDFVGEHTIDAVAVSEPNEAISVSVTAPSNGTHFLDLYKEDPIYSIRIDDGSETVEMPTDEVDPGSFVLRLHSDGTTEDIYPVVIEGYDVTTSHPSAIEAGENVSVEVTITERELTGEPAGGVEVVVWNDDTAKRLEATQTDDLTYTVTLDGSQLEENSYEIYAVAQSDEEYQGENEIVGMSRNGELTVEAAPTEEDDSKEDGGSSDGNSGGGGGESIETTTNTEDSDGSGTEDTSTDESGDNSTTTAVTGVNLTSGDVGAGNEGVGSSENPDSPSSGDITPTTPEQQQTNTAPSTKNPSLITPNSPPTEKTATSTPGFDLPVIVIVLGVAALVVGYSSRREEK